MPDWSQQQLPEERQFQHVLAGCCAIVALFLFAFIYLTVFKRALAPHDVTAAWFAAWGSWGAGLATATAFLIAASSVRVTAAQARADRRDAALVRQSQDMAQARLLMIYQADVPDQPASHHIYRIDNRSKDLFFDVSVPYVERYYRSDTEIGRLTPESVGNTLQRLPQGELLTPYRTQSRSEGWFTEVRVDARPGTPRFAVHYTDASGLSWRQHLGGKIERVQSTQAVPGPPRKADTVQPSSPLRVITQKEAAKESPLRFPNDVPEEVLQLALESVAPDIVQTWSRVSGIGTPKADPIDRQANLVRLQIAYGPTGPDPWGNYLAEKLGSEGIPSFGSMDFGDVQTIILDVIEDDISRMVEVVYEAIAHANDRFEEHDLPAARAAIDRVAAREQAAAERRARIDNLVARYAKPGRAPWEQTTPESSQNQCESNEVVPDEDGADEISPTPPSDA